MLGGAVALAQELRAQKRRPDLLLVSDMLDLTTFLALARGDLDGVPSCLYFHENQLTYPWPETDPDVRLERNHHYGFINYVSALAADRVFFNSDFHRRSFLRGVRQLLQRLPDYQNEENVQKIQSRSEVLSLGLDLHSLDIEREPAANPAPLILWNHRWEYDKNPADFFEVLFQLQAESIDFQLAALGARFRKTPPVFEKARKVLAEQIVHFGYVPDRRTYAEWLHRADLAPVTSRQDFFGISVVEAIYCGCHPLLPNRLAYPEHLPETGRDLFLYEDQEELYEKLKRLLLDFEKPPALISLRDFVARYDWSILAEVYDRTMERVLQEKSLL
jgi:glycosyltransferase involved in cell wall biosynthesis